MTRKTAPKAVQLLKSGLRRVRDYPTTLRPHWHVVGDSHVFGFRAAASRGLLGRPALVTIVGGATATGLRNPNSQTNAIQLFTRALTPLNRRKIPVVHLGEVDCGFVIWNRASRHGESVEAQFEASIAAYVEFVDTLLAMGYPTVVLTGATLPTILDGQDWGEIAHARREVTATLRERTDLTLRYNARLKEAADRRGLPFVDLSDVVLDPETGVVAEAFRNPVATDHHLDPAKIAPEWAKALNRLSL